MATPRFLTSSSRAMAGPPAVPGDRDRGGLVRAPAGPRRRRAAPDELPGGSVWQAIYDEATASPAAIRATSGTACPRTSARATRPSPRSAAGSAASTSDVIRVRPKSPLPFISARELAAHDPARRALDRPPPVRPGRAHRDRRPGEAGRQDDVPRLPVRRGPRTVSPFLGWPPRGRPIVLLSEMHDTPLIQLLERTGLTRPTTSGSCAGRTPAWSAGPTSSPTRSPSAASIGAVAVRDRHPAAVGRDPRRQPRTTPGPRSRRSSRSRPRPPTGSRWRSSATSARAAAWSANRAAARPRSRAPSTSSSARPAAQPAARDDPPAVAS
jgi:hypothetical protein